MKVKTSKLAILLFFLSTVTAFGQVRLPKLISDVWGCSGQSNMELPMRRVSWVYPAEIENAINPAIRQFCVPRKYDFNAPHAEFEAGSWKAANPTSVLDFSAVAYFFAKTLHDKDGVAMNVAVDYAWFARDEWAVS